MPGGAAAIKIAKDKKKAEEDKGKKKPGTKRPSGGGTRTSTASDPDGGEQAVVIPEPEPPELPPTGWRTYQPAAKWLYNHIIIQVGVAGLIGMNFLANIVQAQIDPGQDKHNDVFGVFEWFFNIAFLFELILNMYATWLCEFWHSGWNIFDFAVVLIGWMFQLELPLPGPMKLLRMMRAFRVFRLFKRIASLRKILNSLAKAVPGVMNAFLIQLIVMCIYAIIGVDRFQDYGKGGTFENEAGVEIDLMTARGQEYGFEYFGDFGKALFTMFQVLTGESWSEVICRPLFHSSSATTSFGSMIFFVSFVILNSVVLINVVVAVLLEKMVDDDGAGGDDDDEPEENPVEDAIEATVQDVSQLRSQMDLLVQVSAVMQTQLCDVTGVKEQLAALLTHNGIKQIELDSLALDSQLSAAAQGDGSDGCSPPPPRLTDPMAGCSPPSNVTPDSQARAEGPGDDPEISDAPIAGRVTLPGELSGAAGR